MFELYNVPVNRVLAMIDNEDSIDVDYTSALWLAKQTLSSMVEQRGWRWDSPAFVKVTVNNDTANPFLFGEFSIGLQFNAQSGLSLHIPLARNLDVPALRERLARFFRKFEVVPDVGEPTEDFAGSD